jgi:hypothetical protein
MNQGPRGDCLMKKTEGRKSRDTVPLVAFCKHLLLLYSITPLVGTTRCGAKQSGQMKKIENGSFHQKLYLSYDSVYSEMINKNNG